MRIYLILATATALASGCDDFDQVRGAHETAHAELGHHAIPQVSAEAANRILVVDSNNVGQETEAMGIVDAHEQPGHHAEALAELKARAAGLGADAVVGVEFHHGEGDGEVSHLSGLAVRYRKLRRDQAYDEVGDLDVAADMHDQDEAIQELQRQASEYNADLIIKIHYEHGEGAGEKVHLKGTAIRYRTGGSSAGMP